MQSKITGTTMPVLEIGLEPGDVIIAEPGEFSWMTDNVRLNTSTQTAGARSFFGALGRALSGGGLFMTEYTRKAAMASLPLPPSCPVRSSRCRFRPARST